jgi:hypothetical protein
MRRSGEIPTRLVRWVTGCVGVLLAATCLYAAPPDWWTSRGVFKVPAVSASDYAAVNQGQARHMAKQAYEEFQARLPGGAGPALDALWANPTVGTADYSAINLGQLKTMAKPFYDRLIQLRLRADYPWTGGTAQDYAAANIGQLKNLFDIDVTVQPDSNANGIPDTWEFNYFDGLLASITGDTDGDGVPDINEYYFKTNPRVAEASTAPQKIPGMRLWLKGDAGLPASGPVATWIDQSGRGINASQTTLMEQPQVVTNAANGKTVVRFANTNGLSVYNVMTGATAGEIIAVLKVDYKTPGSYGSDYYNNIWTFGSGNYYSGYYSDAEGKSTYYRFNGFGLSDYIGSAGFPKTLVSDYHIHNTTSSPGLWVERYNGNVYQMETTLTTGFGLNALIGREFVGDFAEIVIYDRVLTQSERDAIHTYLTTKYAPPSITVPTKPVINVNAASPTQAQISWNDQSQSGKLHIYTTVERSTAGGAYEAIAILNGVNNFLDTGGIPSISHSYRIKMKSYAGESPYSDGVSIIMPTGSDDIDGDGMKNSYEIINGLNPRLNDAAGDLDSDGVVNSRDSRPNSITFGQITISISTPLNGSTLP